MAAPGPSTLPPHLDLAVKWAQELGNTAVVISGTYPDGRVIPAIAIKHGMFTVVCREGEGGLHLQGIMDIPPEARSQLRSLDAGSQSKLLTTLKGALMDNPRSGFGFFPVEFKHVYELQKISLDQVVRLVSDDAGTFNRFADAIQELATGMYKAAMVFGPLRVSQSFPGSDPMYR